MSLATRRSASARWRRWATSSARRAPLTIAPSASGDDRGRPRDRAGRASPASRRRSAGRPTVRSGRGSARPARAAASARIGERGVLGRVAEQEPGQGRPARAGATRRAARASGRGCRIGLAGRPGGRSGEIRTGDGARGRVDRRGAPRRRRGDGRRPHGPSDRRRWSASSASSSVCQRRRLTEAPPRGRGDGARHRAGRSAGPRTGRARADANRAAAAGSTVRRPPQVPVGGRGSRLRPRRSPPPPGSAGGHRSGSDGPRAD